MARLAMRFRELVNKVPNARHVWFAWNLADTNNYLPWLFGKEIRGRSMRGWDVWRQQHHVLWMVYVKYWTNHKSIHVHFLLAVGNPSASFSGLIFQQFSTSQVSLALRGQNVSDRIVRLSCADDQRFMEGSVGKGRPLWGLLFYFLQWQGM